jgi:hypothetical protein
MSVPLDRLYQYIENIAQDTFEDDVIIYRFFPDGSKKIEDLRPFRQKTFAENTLQPEIFCNDQEPLDYRLYQDQPNHHRNDPKNNYDIDKILISNNKIFPSFNFRGPIRNIWDHAVLVHSEQRSDQAELYQANQFVTVYYWSHAVIALDWFRYAEHVQQSKQVSKTFLIYNRAWSGTREYRLRFIESLIQSDLQDYCCTTVNPTEPELGIHYNQYEFDNPIWRPQTVVENYFPVSNATSCYSADFDLDDYNSTDIEVVLETLFDDSRLHLTEKILRPIACAQPFILAGTHGSLQYLRSYGFKTFADVWDETYDTIEDPEQRMQAIVDLMKDIATWSSDTHKQRMIQAQEIADYNKKHFFSKEFNLQVEQELKNNFAQAFAQMKSNNTGKSYFERNLIYRSIPELQPLILKLRSNEESDRVLILAKTHVSNKHV